MIFADEKIFTTNGYFNLENDVAWEKGRTDANASSRTHEREAYPISVMVAAWNGLTEPYFFQNDERSNGTTYYKDLLPFYKRRR